jgi:hypothetical protein
MGDIQKGDEVLSEKGVPVKVLAVFPQGKKDTYRVHFSDGSFADCCDEHLWKLNTYRKRKAHKDHTYRLKKLGKESINVEEFEVLSLNQLKDNLFIKTGNTTYRNYKIPLCEPVHFNKQEVLLDPYLLGLLIGDGAMSHGTVSLTNIDEEIIDFLTQEVAKTPDYKLRKKDITYYISKIVTNRHISNEYINALRFYKLQGTKSINKFIPKEYLYNSLEVRISLLQGLMDSDGYIDKDAKASYTTASYKLAEDFQELIHSLGFTGSIIPKLNKKYNRYYYTIYIGYTCQFPIFRLSRKLNRCKQSPRLSGRYIDRVEYLGKVEQQCISVDSEEHLYLTDNFIVTHNTLMKDQIVREGFKINAGQNINVLEFQLEMVGRNSKLREFSAVTKRTYKYLCSAETEGEVVTEEIITKCATYAQEAAKWPISIVDSPCTAIEFRNTIKEYMEKNAVLLEGIKTYKKTVITLDHSVLIKKAPNQSTIDMLNQVGEVCTELKKQYPVLFIILSQLNRDITTPSRCENGKYGNYPNDQDIFGSDALLQHADMVMIMDRPALRHITAYGPERFIIGDDSIIAIHIVKSRTGDTRMSFFTAAFQNMSLEERETPPQEQLKTK